jgi:hypothetical protein
MKQRFGDKIYRRYGFVDAFNPNTGWQAPDVIGIDVGSSSPAITVMRNFRGPLAFICVLNLKASGNSICRSIAMDNAYCRMKSKEII